MQEQWEMEVTSIMYGHGEQWKLQCRRHESARERKTTECLAQSTFPTVLTEE